MNSGVSGEILGRSGLVVQPPCCQPDPVLGCVNSDDSIVIDFVVYATNDAGGSCNGYTLNYAE